MGDTARLEVLNAIDAWDRAMVTNDADAIGAYMAEDWTIVGPDGSVTDKRRFLDQVRSGALTHDVMESHDMDLRMYGDAAVVVARGLSGGAYEGNPFHLVERVSSVFIRADGRWRCVLTHLSKL
jgi:ketosteroid isomerase-like protein